MALYTHIPSTPSSYFVKCFWYSEGAPNAHHKERLLPNGESTIVFNLREDAMRIYNANDLSQFQSHKYALISGARTGCVVIDAEAEDRIFGMGRSLSQGREFFSPRGNSPCSLVQPIFP
jgi:hypothetical protein